MAIDYSLIGRFNQVQPGGLTRAIRGGVDLRGQVLQNEAQQFNLQQAPILAERATQKWNQDLANLQAEEQLNIQKAAEKQQEIKQKELEAQQKRYTDSMSILGRSLYSVNDESQIPIVISSLKQMADTNVIDPNVFYNIPGIKEGRMPTVQEAKVISNSLIETKEQLIKEREAAKALADAEKNKFDAEMRRKQFGLDEKNYAETVRRNKAQESLDLLRINKPSAQEKADESLLKTVPSYLSPFNRGDQVLTKQDVLEIKKKTPATASFIKSINDVLNIVKSGGINVLNPTSKDYAKLSPLITDLGAKYRIIANLGVPNAGDQSLTNSFIGDPTKIQNQVKQLPEILNTAKNLILTGYNDEMNVYGFNAIPENVLTGGEKKPKVNPIGYIYTDPETGKKYQKIGNDEANPKSWKEVR